MNMSEHARRILDQEGVPALLHALQLHARALDSAARELAVVEQRIPWWDRALFFTDTVDETRAAELRRQHTTAKAAHGEALASWRAAMERAQSYAPIEIVSRVELAIHQLRSRPAAGCDDDASEEMAASLDAIAARVKQLWAPEVSFNTLAWRLFDDEARQSAQAEEPGPTRTDATLGYAPVDEEELFARVARSLSYSDEFRHAKERFEAETREDASVKRQLDEALAAVTWWDRVTPMDSPREKLVAKLEAAAKREHAETLFAHDWLRLAVARCFAVHPVMWIYFALRGATVLLQTAKPRDEPILLPPAGEMRMVPSRYRRVAALAGMVEVRRACDRAFPGLRELVWPRDELDGVGPLDSPGEQSPYRMAGHIEHEPIVAQALADPTQAFRQQLRHGGLRRSLGHAIAGATVLAFLEGDLEHVEGDIAWTDKLAFWSDTDAERARDTIADRVEANRQSIETHSLHALALVQQAAGEHPLLSLAQALTSCNVAASEIRTQGGSSSSPMHCPVYNRDDALTAISAVGQSLTRYYGTQGTRTRWIDDVLQRLQRASPPAAPSGHRLSYHQAMDLVASRLVQTDFAALVVRARQLGAEHDSAKQQAHVAGERVSFWDKVNVFSDTEDEKIRDAWEERAAAIAPELNTIHQRMHALFDAAVAAYPPLLVHEGLDNVRHALSQIYAQSERRTRTHTTRDSKGRVTSRRTETYYVCVIYGVKAAQRAVQHVTQRALAGFGPLPTASAVLEAEVSRDL